LISFSLVLFSSYSQSKETIYYNDSWKGVKDVEQAEIYVVVNFDSNKAPVGEINVYYTSGEIKYNIESAKYIDREDALKSIFIGKLTRYYITGEVAETLTYNSDGLMIDDNIQYYKSGNIKSKATFNSYGILEGTVKFFYENGLISQESKYNGNTLNGKSIYYNDKGVKISEKEFVDGEPKFDWYLKFDDKGNSLKHDLKTDELYYEVSTNSNIENVDYELTLSSNGNLKNKGDFSGDILCFISEGTTVGVYGFENDYFKIYHNGYIGYISKYSFSENDIPNNSFVTSRVPTNIVSLTKRNTLYKDGDAYQYYVNNGISVTMHLSIEKSYGKYYVAYITIENLTGESFMFNPNSISAELKRNNGIEKGEVLSSDEYLRKIKRRQNWNSALVAFAESYNASNAGYSSSYTKTNTSGYSNSYSNVYGAYGNSYVNLYGDTSTYGSYASNSSTQSYNGAAAYTAQQNAQRNINEFKNQQNQIKNVLNQGYLKRNTIFNNQLINGQINIKYKKADEISIIVSVNGDDYEFNWST
jgi:antitoxin component YwqK of YwqJK toxin-antitoxin module